MACAQRCIAAFLLLQLLSTSQAGFLARKHDGDDGDLAEAEVEKIQLSEQLDNNNEEKGASTEDDDSEEEFDVEEEARRSEMYEDYNGADSAALIQGRAKDRSDSRKHDGDDGDLAEAEVEKIQLSEQLDNNNETVGLHGTVGNSSEQLDSTEDDDSEEEFDAEEEARKSEMYEDYNGADSAALIQGRAKARSVSRKHDGDDGDLAEAEVEKIQLSEQLDNNDEEKEDDSEEEFDAEEEARKSEMYEDYNGADSAALTQGRAKARSVSRTPEQREADELKAQGNSFYKTLGLHQPAEANRTSASSKNASRFHNSPCQKKIKKGFEKGFAAGVKKGFKDGFKKGFAAGARKGFAARRASRRALIQGRAKARSVSRTSRPNPCREKKNKAFKKGFKEGFNKGFKEGFNKGFKKGFRAGVKKGFAARRASRRA